MNEQSAKLPMPQRLLFWLLLVVLLVPGACTQNEIGCFENLSKDGSDDATLAGTWKVIAYEDLVNNTGIVKDNTNSWGGLDIVLTFAGDRISGKNTTNEVFGTFSYAGPGKVTIHSFGGSKVGEPEWGRLFTKAVYQFEAFTIKDRLLTFYYNNGQNTITLEKQ
jgi:hypothetical protein